MLTPHIDPEAKTPIYTQIYSYIRSEIEAGRISRGERLPSTRALSEHLLIGRNTVEMAYGQLSDEGYIEAIPKKGYFVCDISANIPPIAYSAASKEPDGEEQTAAYDYSFSPYGVDLENFPYSTWRKTMRDILYDDRNLSLFEAGMRQGDQDLRQAIADYLHRNRGVNCNPQQIIIGAGTDYLLMLLTQILPSGSVFAIEDPSYMQAWRVLTHLHLRVDPIALDKNGMDIKKLEKSEANIAYITPSHQFPSGIIMPIGRRQEILAWAGRRADRFIIEDDYDSEFRYRGRPIPSLQGIDQQQKVIYLGTFSKAIAPSIRISYLVLPQQLLPAYLNQCGFYTNTVPRMDQKQITQFMRSGHFERHLNKMRIVYKTKRDYILKELEPYADRLQIYGENSGLHMLLHFPDGRSEAELLALAAQQRLHLYALSDYTVLQENRRAFSSTIMLGYANITIEELKPAMRRLIRGLIL